MTLSDSIFAPPEADVETPAERSHDYYVVSPTKFFLLSVLTFDLYVVYWFYRNWRLIKERDKDTSWPPMRGVFFVFFTHSLMTDIVETMKTRGKEYDWQPMTTATFVVIVAIASNVIDRMATQGVGSPTTDVVGTALAIVLPAILLQGQRAINFACDDVGGKTNSTYTLANWVWMVIGGLVWLLSIFGLYAMLFAPELLLE